MYLYCWCLLMLLLSHRLHIFITISLSFFFFCHSFWFFFCLFVYFVCASNILYTFLVLFRDINSLKKTNGKRCEHIASHCKLLCTYFFYICFCNIAVIFLWHPPRWFRPFDGFSQRYLLFLFCISILLLISVFLLFLFGIVKFYACWNHTMIIVNHTMLLTLFPLKESR